MWYTRTRSSRDGPINTIYIYNIFIKQIKRNIISNRYWILAYYTASVIHTHSVVYCIVYARGGVRVNIFNDPIAPTARRGPYNESCYYRL